MKAKEKRKNDNTTPQADALADLPVMDEQAGQTQAGAGTGLFRESNWGKGKTVHIDL